MLCWLAQWHLFVLTLCNHVWRAHVLPTVSNMPVYAAGYPYEESLSVSSLFFSQTGMVSFHLPIAAEVQINFTECKFT